MTSSRKKSRLKQGLLFCLIMTVWLILNWFSRKWSFRDFLSFLGFQFNPSGNVCLIRLWRQNLVKQMLSKCRLKKKVQSNFKLYIFAHWGGLVLKTGPPWKVVNKHTDTKGCNPWNYLVQPECIHESNCKLRQNSNLIIFFFRRCKNLSWVFNPISNWTFEFRRSTLNHSYLKQIWNLVKLSKRVFLSISFQNCLI